MTGVPGAGKSTIAKILAVRLARPVISLDAIKEARWSGVPAAPDRHQVRLDAEAELVTSLEAVGGVAVVDIWVAPRRDTRRVLDLLHPWAATATEVRCVVPADVAVTRYSARSRPAHHLPADGPTLDRIRDAVGDPEPLGLGRYVQFDTSDRVNLPALEQLARHLTS